MLSTFSHQQRLQDNNETENTQSLTGDECENLGGEVNRAFHTELLVLATADEVSRD